MAVLNGYSGGVQFVQGSPAVDTGDITPPSVGNAAVIDGTPVRVVVLALSAAAGLAALHIAGFRFSIGVSG